MKKIILLVTVLILGLYTLKAQYPDMIFSTERAFEFRLPESSLWIQEEVISVPVLMKILLPRNRR
jgi:hypothetical protein